MLTELRIENLLLIERAELTLTDGLNVFTGETGAGKTMLAHAIDLLLGGRSKRGIVRPGASEAYVEGLFRIPPGLLERAEFSELRERLPDPDGDEIALARRVTPEGRTRAYIEGRSARAGDLQQLGGALVAFYGQHEHRKLTLAGAQLAILDAAATRLGKGHEANLRQLATLHGRAHELQSTLTDLQLLDGRRERELGLIEFELAEIDELAPDPDEELRLGAERARLRDVDQLRRAAEAAIERVEADDAANSSAGGARILLAEAVEGLQAVAGSDAELDLLAGRAESLLLELQDLADELRIARASMAADPERLAELDNRLDDYERIKRKHGGSIEQVLAHAEQCRADRDRLRGSEDRIEAVEAELAAVRSEQQELAGAVAKLRRKAAPKLAATVRERLAELAMEGASFEIEISQHEGGIQQNGSDVVEFMISPNPGIAPSSLRETASGGELSRVMLALLTAAATGEAAKPAKGGKAAKPAKGASTAGHQQTLVFDEIDAGIGGHTARAVGDQLRRLGAERQLICITHLPQVAAAAETHFRIVKTSEGEHTETLIDRLEESDVIDELCRMLGADGDDDGARRHAEQLLATA